MTVTRVGLAALFLLASSAFAIAQTKEGCDRLAWPLDKERQMLAAANLPIRLSGDTIEHLSETAFSLGLSSGAALAMPPERKPRGEEAFAGFVRFAGVAKPGPYRITISADGWVDVIQDRRYLKPTMFTGAPQCAGLRKSVQVELAASPLIIQISDAKSDRVGVAITPVP